MVEACGGSELRGGVGVDLVDDDLEKGTMTKEIALGLITELANASINMYQVSNGDRKGSIDKADSREQRAARKLVTALLGSDSGVTDDEIREALT